MLLQPDFSMALTDKAWLSTRTYDRRLSTVPQTEEH